MVRKGDSHVEDAEEPVYNNLSETSIKFVKMRNLEIEIFGGSIVRFQFRSCFLILIDASILDASFLERRPRNLVIWVGRGQVCWSMYTLFRNTRDAYTSVTNSTYSDFDECITHETRTTCHFFLTQESRHAQSQLRVVGSALDSIQTQRSTFQ